MPRGGKYIVGMLAAGTVLALIVGCAALAITIAISQTELKFLQQQINDLRETALNQTSEIKQLQQKLDYSTDTVEVLADQVSTLEQTRKHWMVRCHVANEQVKCVLVLGSFLFGHLEINPIGRYTLMAD